MLRPYNVPTVSIMLPKAYDPKAVEDQPSPRRSGATAGRSHLPKTYDPSLVEDRIYKMWEESGAFRADVHSKKEPFTISMPPPNATGQLHLGHAVMLALEDIFIRFARMRGKETLWVPGADHAAIATNAIMERKLREEGTDKHRIGRAEFLRRLREYIEESRGTIRSQIRKMGASCDWSRERYTMDPALCRSVNEVFAKMYDDGLIYRGKRIVNWCPRCHSTLSDDEVEYEEREEMFFTIRYGPILIGTVRPETKFGDTAVAVHPDDERYKTFVGREIEIDTAIGKARIRVIADDAVDPNFGTGALKVTPAHDFKDFDMASRHGLPVVQVIDENGCMMEKAGPFRGMTTLECRKAMIASMEEKGILVKQEPYTHNLSVCYRCRHPVEPLPKLQWFIDVNKKVVRWGRLLCIIPRRMSLKEVMQDVIRSGDIRIIPERFEKTYFHWIDNLRDWCISRQIWWGHRVPVWYCTKCGGIDSSVEKEQREKDKGLRNVPLSQVLSPKSFVSVKSLSVCPDCGGEVEQDPDTLDTWFSSALWTWSTLIDPSLADDHALTLRQLLEGSPDFRKFHPTRVMETGYDILFFWVARMILMTTYATGQIPFETVYLHGLIRTRDGRKMSKSASETCIDPLEIIPRYGADALRLSMIVGQSPGNDSRLYDEKIAGYRNFVNKLWNAARFVLLECDKSGTDPLQVGALHATPLLADRALLSELQKLIEDVTEGLENYRLSEVGERLYGFVWDYFCDWYLEISKGNANVPVLVHTMRTLLTLLHPYCPFVTEELWTSFKHGDDGMLLKSQWPAVDESLRDEEAAADLQTVIDVVSAVRQMRSEYDVAPAKEIAAVLVVGPGLVGAQHAAPVLESQAGHIRRLARIGHLTIQRGKFAGKQAASAFTRHVEVHVPLEGLIDLARERERLTSEKEKLQTFLDGVRARLGNGEFARNAPKEVIEKERMKETDATQRLEMVQSKIATLGL